MSPGGRAERLGFLRHSIAQIEAGTPTPARRADGWLCEVLPTSAGDAPAALAFALQLAHRRAGATGAIVWISDEMTLAQRGLPYAPGLAAFGVAAAQITLVRTLDARAALLAMEEALRSPGPAVVLGEMWDAARHFDLATTRRFWLAVRAGGGLGLLLHPAPAPGPLSTAARERFEVRAMPGQTSPSARQTRNAAPADLSGDAPDAQRGLRPVFGAPLWQVRRLKGQGSTSSGETINLQREFSGVALSEPQHPRRARR